MDQKTQELLEYYGIENKNDFFSAYLYMKYLHQFVSLVMKNMGLPINPESENIDPAVEEMIQAHLNIIGQSGASPETNAYHSKVVKLDDAKKLVTEKVDLNIKVPESIVPFKLARDVILKNPDSIAVGTCPCRYAQAECKCMPPPMEACMFLGDPFASFIAEHNPKFRKVSQEEAVKILEDCHNKGFVQCAYFKKDMGNRLYAICNCCSCCCGGLKIHNMLAGMGITTTSVAPSGYVAQVGENCTGCRQCIEMCRFNAISMDANDEYAAVDTAKCMGCGICETQCTTGAISLRVEPSKGGIFDLDEMKKSAA
jgi:Pyruvate/2-oxoacid:ferredoxin oxidoreductase delta subunit